MSRIICKIANAVPDGSRLASLFDGIASSACGVRPMRFDCVECRAISAVWRLRSWRPRAGCTLR